MIVQAKAGSRKALHLELLLNCQCCFRVVVTLERNILLRLIGLTVTEINIKKVQKQEKKNIRNKKKL